MPESKVVFTLKEEHRGKTNEEKSAIFDDEVELFSHYFDTIPNSQGGGPLTKGERMLIKTYLVCKETGRI